MHLAGAPTLGDFLVKSVLPPLRARLRAYYRQQIDAEGATNFMVVGEY